MVTKAELGDVDAAMELLAAAGVEAVAVCFMHAYANDEMVPVAGLPANK